MLGGILSHIKVAKCRFWPKKFTVPTFNPNIDIFYFVSSKNIKISFFNLNFPSKSIFIELRKIFTRSRQFLGLKAEYFVKSGVLSPGIFQILSRGSSLSDFSEGGVELYDFCLEVGGGNPYKQSSLLPPLSGPHAFLDPWGLRGKYGIKLQFY